MGYLVEFQNRINNIDLTGFLQLWEEYCAGDQIDAPEFSSVLEAIKGSPLAEPFGEYAETALTLWEQVEDEKISHAIMSLIMDLQTSNSPQLGELAYNYLKDRYGLQELFNEKIRLIGLRNQEVFQGCISNYELLTHLDQGKHVYHTGGWGTGEIVDISLIREELILEFENVGGRKDLTFANAFSNLVPLPEDHFLSRRFGNPDDLEEDAKANPVKIIKRLLQDLGPKTATEIKEEMNELVIPADDWTKWWQSARAKIKKDTMIASPSTLREPFIIRDSEVSHEERFRKRLKDLKDNNVILQAIYNFTRDFPETLKSPEFKNSLKDKLLSILSQEEATKAQKIQVYVFLEGVFGKAKEDGVTSLAEFIREQDNLFEIMDKIEIISFRKRVLLTIRECREDWKAIFIKSLHSSQQSIIRDYLLKELNKEESELDLKELLHQMIESPTLYPEMFIWYFQKCIGKEESTLPFSDIKGQRRMFEAFLILYHYLEQDVKYRDLVKKMYTTLSSDRYSNVRFIFKDSEEAYVKELLLLSTKCQTLTAHDISILYSLAEVVHPSLSKKNKKGKKSFSDDVIWTTQEGYQKVQERIHHIGTIETVENAKEIEAARALGDLRENSEYKYALEKRNRLQGEIKLLSDQMNKARILTKNDISADTIGIGSIANIEGPQGKHINYTILGPWEADPDNNVLSFQSKLAQTMDGYKIGEKFSFQGSEYTVTGLNSFL